MPEEIPAIFHFKTKVVKVDRKDPEAVAKWEKAMRELCGIPGAKASNHATLSTTICQVHPDVYENDDCD